MHKLIGLRLIDRKSMRRGRIVEISDDKMKVSYAEGVVAYDFPAAMVDTLLLEDEELQKKYLSDGSGMKFDKFKNLYKNAVYAEIAFLRETGGKRYRIIDGERLKTEQNIYIYSFETDSELHFPDSTVIKLWFPEKIIPARVVSCEEFNITIQPVEYLGELVESVEFTAEPWQLLEALVERIDEMDVASSPIAYELACRGLYQINPRKFIGLGQNLALTKSSSQPVTFIWGPPGKGKTTTLAKIALEHMLKGERVLMLSYSNVSVDGAVLRVANMSDFEPGHIIRYGYPRVQELMESETLTSYGYVLYKNRELAKEYKELIQEGKKYKNNDPRRLEIRRRLNNIREHLIQQERELVQYVEFVATTVSKAIVDKTLYSQKFDIVIFD